MAKRSHYGCLKLFLVGLNDSKTLLLRMSKFLICNVNYGCSEFDLFLKDLICTCVDVSMTWDEIKS